MLVEIVVKQALPLDFQQQVVVVVELLQYEQMVAQVVEQVLLAVVVHHLATLQIPFLLRAIMVEQMMRLT